jgi:hypothetical protein
LENDFNKCFSEELSGAKAIDGNMIGKRKHFSGLMSSITADL